MPSKQAEHCIPDRWPCHSVRASPPWTTCSPRRGCSSAGTNVGPIWQSCWRCCQQCHCSGGCTWHPEIHGERAAEWTRKRLVKVVHETQITPMSDPKTTRAYCCTKPDRIGYSRLWNNRSRPHSLGLLACGTEKNRRKIFSREDIFARRYFPGMLFSREDIFAGRYFRVNIIFAKISSRENISNSLFAKISSRENKVLYSITLENGIAIVTSTWCVRSFLPSFVCLFVPLFASLQFAFGQLLRWLST